MLMLTPEDSNKSSAPSNTKPAKLRAFFMFASAEYQNTLIFNKAPFPTRVKRFPAFLERERGARGEWEIVF